MSSNTEAQSLLKVAKERMMQRPGKVLCQVCEVMAVCVQSHAEWSYGIHSFLEHIKKKNKVQDILAPKVFELVYFH